LTGTSRDRGILFSFEGLDASGKNTQTQLLSDFLKERNSSFELLSFPVYSTSIGKEIREYLSDGRDYSPETVHLLYAANRYEFKSVIDRWIAEKRIVLLNRYCESNIAYGVADGLSRVWVEQLESKMPQSDYVFYLKVDPNVSLERKASRDRYEADLKFLTRVSQVYDALAEDSRWISVDAERDPALIQYEIRKIFEALLKEKGIDVNCKRSSEDSRSSEDPLPR